MTSLTRSALFSAAASRCCRCRRMLRYPKSPKVATRAMTSKVMSLALRLCPRRFQVAHSPRIGSISRILKDHGGGGHRLRTYGSGVRLVLRRKNRQILGSQRKQSESYGNDGPGYGDFGPLGHIMHAGG